jgi:hypothetical protein
MNNVYYQPPQDISNFSWVAFWPIILVVFVAIIAFLFARKFFY